MIVVDTNIIAYLWLDSKRSDLVDAVHGTDPDWIVPRLWRYEFLNVLTSYIRNKNLPIKDALSIWRQALSTFQRSEYESDPEHVVHVSSANRISAYDAQFITLAVQKGVKLVTEHRDLLDKFHGTAISMEDFTAPDSSDRSVKETGAVYNVGRPAKKKKTSRRV
jgi:predicted nucleic acid-binding protein